MDKEMLQILHSINNNLTILAKNQLKISMMLTEGKSLHMKKIRDLRSTIDKYDDSKKQ